MKRIRILLADDHAVVRQGFKMILGAEPDMEIVGEAGNGREAVEQAEQLRPDIVVMDVAMPELNGIEATRRLADQLRNEGFSVKICPPPQDRWGKDWNWSWRKYMQSEGMEAPRVFHKHFYSSVQTYYAQSG